MSVKQLSIVLENVPGKLSEASEFLGIEGINIRAISVADSSNFSTVRFVADDTKKAATVLKSRGYIVSEMDVIAVEVPDHFETVIRGKNKCSLSVSFPGEESKRPNDPNIRIRQN
jgi:hypothetical protein